MNRKKVFFALKLFLIILLFLAIVIAVYINSNKTIRVPENNNPIQEATDNYVSPIDFNSLKMENPHIYSWITVKNTKINYPIVQHPTDDNFYLRRDYRGKRNVNGVIFSENKYNKKDFNDPVTILYGHNIKNGLMFGDLQKCFSNEEFMKNDGQITIYLEDKEIKYKAFAALPFENWHILHSCDFSDERVFNLFFKKINETREIGTCFDYDYFPEFGDKVLIMSTCLNGNRNKRYIVCAVKCDS